MNIKLTPEQVQELEKLMQQDVDKIKAREAAVKKREEIRAQMDRLGEELIELEDSYAKTAWFKPLAVSYLENIVMNKDAKE